MIYDKGKIFAGLAIFVGLVASPFWYNPVFGTGSSAPPQVPLPKDGSKCVLPRAEMRASHMQVIYDWRETVVRGGARTLPAPRRHRAADEPLEHLPRLPRRPGRSSATPATNTWRSSRSAGTATSTRRSRCNGHGRGEGDGQTGIPQARGARRPRGRRPAGRLDPAEAGRGAGLGGGRRAARRQALGDGGRPAQGLPGRLPRSASAPATRSTTSRRSPTRPTRSGTRSSGSGRRRTTAPSPATSRSTPTRTSSTRRSRSSATTARTRPASRSARPRPPTSGRTGS